MANVLGQVIWVGLEPQKAGVLGLQVKVRAKAEFGEAVSVQRLMRRRGYRRLQTYHDAGADVLYAPGHLRSRLKQ